MKMLYVIFGISERGEDEIYGLGWIKNEEELELNEVCRRVLNKGVGFFGYDLEIDYIDEWGRLDKEYNLYEFSDDWGFYCYIGESSEKVLGLWGSYFDDIDENILKIN